jgi:hypothetical protein
MALNGIEIDLCEGCQAVWLDKGELEKADASLKDPARRHPPSRISADDLGIFGGLGESMLERLFRNPGWGLLEAIIDILRRRS